MNRISNLHSHTKRFIVAADGFDQHGTFPECWGSHSKYNARAVASSDSIGEAKLIAAAYYDAIIYDRETGKKVGKERLAAEA